MYCPHFHLDNRECSGVCIDCPYGFNPNFLMSQTFNYECPDCHGKFNIPATPGVSSTCLYKCPFCGKVMEGL